MIEGSKAMRDEETEIDLQEIFGLLLQRLWLLLICGLAGGAIAFCISFFLIVPEYESTTSVYILNKNNNSNTVTYSDLQLGSQLTKDYAQLITSRNVLEAVIETCQLADSYVSLKDRVNVNAVSDTRLIAIKVTDTDPIMAQMIANEIRKVAAVRIKEVMDIQAVNVVDEANLPTAPVSPSVPKWTAIGLLMGMMLCAAIIIIRFLLDDTIKTAEDVDRYLQLSTLAMIPVIENPEDAVKKKRRKGKKPEPRRASEEDLDEIDLDRVSLKKEEAQPAKKEAPEPESQPKAAAEKQETEPAKKEEIKQENTAPAQGKPQQGKKGEGHAKH